VFLLERGSIMGKRVHIIGCSSRSGTTLMNELMVTCFQFDGSAEHEHSIFREYDPVFKTFCSKRPIEAEVIKPLLHIDENLWIIYMLRDPRDVVSSCSHRMNNGAYMGNLGLWLEQQEAVKELVDEARFITVRYEDLVIDPNRVQGRLVELIPFLQKKCDFSQYHLNARSSEKSIKALNGIRKINSNNVGSWKRHLPQVAKQLECYGDISDELIQLGYEESNNWMKEFSSLEPGSVVATVEERKFKKKLSKKFIRYKQYVLYWLNTYPSLNRCIYKWRSGGSPKKYIFVSYDVNL